MSKLTLHKKKNNKNSWSAGSLASSRCCLPTSREPGVSGLNYSLKRSLKKEEEEKEMSKPGESQIGSINLQEQKSVSTWYYKSIVLQLAGPAIGTQCWGYIEHLNTRGISQFLVSRMLYETSSERERKKRQEGDDRRVWEECLWIIKCDSGQWWFNLKCIQIRTFKKKLCKWVERQKKKSESFFLTTNCE